MYVVNADRDMSGAERTVVGWLQAWTMPGIAISGCIVPDRRNPARGYEADLVLITPQALTVIEVKGVTTKASGTLTCSANDRWRLSGVAGDPIHVRNGDTNPLDQVSGRMFDLKTLAESIINPAFVAAIVMVMPPADTDVRLDIGPLPPGRDILIGGTGSGIELRRWLERSSRRTETPWTLDSATAMLDALRITSVAPEQLAAAGFQAAKEVKPPAAPAILPEPVAPVVPLRLVPPPDEIQPSTPIVKSAPSAPARVTSRDLGRRTASATDHLITTPDAFTAPTKPARTAVNAGLTAAVIAVVVGGLVGAGVWATVSADEPSDPQPTEQQITTGSEPAPQPESPAPSPAARPRVACFPFQADCNPGGSPPAPKCAMFCSDVSAPGPAEPSPVNKCVMFCGTATGVLPQQYPIDL